MDELKYKKFKTALTLIASTPSIAKVRDEHIKASIEKGTGSVDVFAVMQGAGYTWSDETEDWQPPKYYSTPRRLPDWSAEVQIFNELGQLKRIWKATIGADTEEEAQRQLNNLVENDLEQAYPNCSFKTTKPVPAERTKP